MIKAQLVNPGVGPFANVIMAMASTFGPDNMPEEMLAAMEDIIDSVQQTADILAFAAISDETNRLWTWFYNKVLADQVKVDAGLLATRVPTKLGSGDDAINLVDDIIAAGLKYDGPQRNLHKLYSRCIVSVGEVGKRAAHEARLNTPLATYMRNYRIGVPGIKAWATNWLRNVNGQLKKLDREFGNIEANHVIERRNTQTLRRLALEQLMDNWVNTIYTDGQFNSADQFLALYKLIVTPTSTFPLGDNDRVFVQPSSAGMPSMMGMFLTACEEKGILLDLQLDALTLG